MIHLDQVFTPKNVPKLSVCVDVTSANLTKSKEPFFMHRSSWLEFRMEKSNP